MKDVRRRWSNTKGGSSDTKSAARLEQSQCVIQARFVDQDHRRVSGLEEIFGTGDFDKVFPYQSRDQTALP